MAAPASSDLFVTPKPTGLVKRILQIATETDSLVIDSFAGSGTTAHAVLALNKEDGGNRKFILVECEDYADTITAERVRRVITEFQTHETNRFAKAWGGSFTYWTLGEPIDIEQLLTGDGLPSYSALAAYLLHTASVVSAGAASLERRNDDGLFYSDDAKDYYLLYEPDLDWLSSNDGILNEERAKRISAASLRQWPEGHRIRAGQVHRPERPDAHGDHLLPATLRDARLSVSDGTQGLSGCRAGGVRPLAGRARTGAG